jgi:hypothetical protein
MKRTIPVEADDYDLPVNLRLCKEHQQHGMARLLN